jgi:hypothetical protein
VETFVWTGFDLVKEKDMGPGRGSNQEKIKMGGESGTAEWGLRFGMNVWSMVGFGWLMNDIGKEGWLMNRHRNGWIIG